MTAPKDRWQARDGGTLRFVHLSPDLVVDRQKIESISKITTIFPDGGRHAGFHVRMASGNDLFVEADDAETVDEYVRTRILPDGRWT